MTPQASSVARLGRGSTRRQRRAGHQVGEAGGNVVVDEATSMARSLPKRWATDRSAGTIDQGRPHAEESDVQVPW